MPAFRRLATIAVFGLWAASATPVLADHCGATGIIEPATGRPGTTFLFTSNLGTIGDLYLYKDGMQVRSLVLDGNTYRIHTRPGDAGAWRVRVVAQRNQLCESAAMFTVLGAPDTATAPIAPSSASPWPFAWLTGVAGFVLALARSDREPRRPGVVDPPG